MEMTEKEFNELEETHTLVANGWSSMTMSVVTVLGNEHGTPVAIRYSSQDTGYEFRCLRIATPELINQ